VLKAICLRATDVDLGHYGHDDRRDILLSEIERKGTNFYANFTFFEWRILFLLAHT